MNRLRRRVASSLIGRLTEWSGITSSNPCQTSVHRNSKIFRERSSALILPGLASLILRCSSRLYISRLLLCGPCIAWWNDLKWHAVRQTCWLWNDSVVFYRYVSWSVLYVRWDANELLIFCRVAVSAAVAVHSSVCRGAEANIHLIFRAEW